MERRRHKHVVDAAVGLHVRVEGVERPVFGKAEPRGGVRIFEDARLGENLIDFVGLVDVEIARQYHGQPAGDGPDSFHHEFGRLAPCHHAHMVHVEIEIKECPFGVHVAKLAVSADSDAGGIPSQTRFGGCGRKPEITMTEHANAFLVVENS